MLVAVDLAAKYSAAVIMDKNGLIIDQKSSWGMTEDEFLEWIVRPWRMSRCVYFGQTEWFNPPDILIVEDLPHKVPFMTITKKVCRMQGRIYEKMHYLRHDLDMLMVPPATWIRSYGIKTMKDSAKLVQPKAEELGYTPPEDYTKYTGKDRQTARKVNTDYCSAYLIGRWANAYHAEHGTYDAPNTSRFKNG